MDNYKSNIRAMALKIQADCIAGGWDATQLSWRIEQDSYNTDWLRIVLGEDPTAVFQDDLRAELNLSRVRP